MNRLPRKLLFIAAVLSGLLMAASLALAGGTGKIKGVVTDKESGEPIPGASVMLMGTKQGAQTDPDGKYMISLVPPATYVIKVTSISYSATEVTDVAVSTDLTTEVNVKMVKAVTDLNKVIRVRADRDIINKFETQNEVKISREAIKTMPVQNVDKLIQQAAGVVTTSQGEIIIRGGRGPMSLGLSLTSVSIQEISIIKDGFDPEYGNALSGIIEITTQTGSVEKTNMAMQYITDDFGNSRLNKYSENQDYLSFSLSGPDPILRSKILPALGINFLKDKDLTYFFYAEMTKSGTPYSYDKFATPITAKQYRSFNLFGIQIPERQNNDYSINGNVLIKPLNNIKMIFSYKASVNRYSVFDWQYRYSPNTALLGETKWQSYSLEITHQLSKNMHYYLRGSYYNRDVSYKPGDPNNPGYGLNPDQFLRYYDFERYDDRNANGVYDAPEPLINVFPDTTLYGRDLAGPAYTYGNSPFVNNAQGGYTYQTDFRFNNGSRGNGLEGEPYVDLNGNGQWDAGDYLYDTNGNGKFDSSRADVIGSHSPEPYLDGDVNLGEPFTDVNNNGVFDPGVDIFVMSPNPALNMDLDRNSRYTAPFESWVPGIPFIDRNGNGVYDAPNRQYDPGEPFTDINGNGAYDYGGTSNFLNVGNYQTETIWHHRRIQQYTLEGRLFRQLGVHEIKAGAELLKEYLMKEDIRSLEQPYTGRSDNGAYPGIGELRDFYTYAPLSGAVYMRDNLEYGSMIANLGFRYDFFLQTKGLEEVARNDDLGSGIIKGDRTRFSPRIGFSYPISDKAKIHFNYGHFYQLPSYSFMYDRNTTSASASDVVGNYNLDFVKTIQYSFGVKYAMSQDYSIDLSGYFKDEFDKINSANVRLGGGALVIQQYQNRDYGRSRGFEVQIEKRGGRLINGEVNYTYAFAYGKQSQTRTTYFSDFYLSRESLSEKPLDNDVRHALKCGVQLVIPETMKPKMFGLRIPNGWTFSVQGSYETGRPFTPGTKYPNLVVQQGVDIDENSMRRPSVLNFDVRFEKYFKLVSMNWRAILWVNNLLDNKNVQAVYGDTGRPDTNQNDGYNVTGGTAYDSNPQNWAYGRQIQFGLQLSL